MSRSLVGKINAVLPSKFSFVVMEESVLIARLQHKEQCQENEIHQRKCSFAAKYSKKAPSPPSWTLREISETERAKMVKALTKKVMSTNST